MRSTVMVAACAVAMVTLSFSDPTIAAPLRRSQVQVVAARGCAQRHTCVTACLAYRDRGGLDGPRTTVGNEPGSAGEGSFRVYLPVWERLIAALDDLLLREAALGGPDTSARPRVSWRMRFTRVGGRGATLRCARSGNGFRSARVRRVLVVSPTASVLGWLTCDVPPESGTVAVENQLYRIAINDSGAYATAMFGWSRDDGSRRLFHRVPQIPRACLVLMN